MNYESVALSPVISIARLYTIHYFEYMSNFSFSGESHDFWEFLCVDKGEVNVTAGSQQHSLSKDEVIFHQPGEFHDVASNGRVAPNLVVISFECRDPAMDFFRERVLTISEEQRNLLGEILAEARALYCTPLDDPYLTAMQPRKEIPFASAQMIRLHLEEFLIRLIRQYTIEAAGNRPPHQLKQKNDSDLYERIMDYLEQHIYSPLSIDQICRDNLVGRSQLQKLFREQNDCGIIDYFSRMKIQTAKQLIRSQSLNFTQIADTLGYSSVHYFSRQFKNMTGMTPSEYSSSIKKRSEEPLYRRR